LYTDRSEIYVSLKPLAAAGVDGRTRIFAAVRILEFFDKKATNIADQLLGPNPTQQFQPPKKKTKKTKTKHISS
jgi:hypothetical protein